MNILVIGGSQAAKIFAEDYLKYLKIKKTSPSIKVYQQCQEKQVEKVIKFL